jgi:hypothetical protein
MTWRELNTWLRTASAEDCKKAIDAEIRGECRLRILLRFHARMNRVRAADERARYVELVAGRPE